tara:strand:+ start:39348 stop:43385 length:4038 start_codon:yes stop_codon:yes gene_type:complete
MTSAIASSSTSNGGEEPILDILSGFNRNNGEQNMRRLIDALPAAVYTTDKLGRVTHYNPACETVSGRTPMLGRDRWCVTWKLFRPDGRSLPHEECPMAVTLKTGEPVRGAEVIVERPDGSRIWCLPHPTPLFDNEGEIIGGVNMLVEITERKLAEVVLESEKTALEMLAKGDSLEDVLKFLITTAETHAAGRADCSIALLDESGTRFVGGVGPKLSDSYHDIVKGLPINTDIGCCCRAVSLCETVVLSDVTADPHWARFAEIVTPMGYRSAWSVPILSGRGKPLGAFANYARQPGTPSETHLRFVKDITRTAALIIERARADEAVRRSEERFRGFTNATTDVTYSMNPDWSQLRHVQGRGFVADTTEPLSDWISTYVHPEDRQLVSETVRRAIETRSTYDLEHRVYRVDGSVGWTHSRAVPITGADGEIVEWFGAASDITQRRQTEEALRKRESIMAGQREALEQAVNDASLESSLGTLVQTAIRGVGKGSRAGFYLANEERTTLRHVVGMPPEYARAIEGFAVGPDSLACGLATHTGRPILTRDVRDEPKWKPWLWLAEQFDYRACWSFPIRTEQGKFVGTLAIYWRQPREASAQDVEICELLAHTASIIIGRHADSAARRQAEQALARSERLHRQTLSLMPAAVYSCDADGIITYFNDQASKIWGRTPRIGDKEELFCGSERLQLPDGSTLPHERCPMAIALNEGQAFRNAEVHICRPDGSTVPVMVNIEPIRNDQGDVVGAINAFVDVSAAKQAEDKLRRYAQTFAQLVEQSPLGIFTVDADFRVANISIGAIPAFRNVDPIIGRDLGEVMEVIWPEPIASEVVGLFRQTLDTGEPYVSPGLVGKRKDIGQIESYEWQINRAVLSDGRPGVVCYFFDTTRIQQVNDALRDSEERFRMLADNMAQLAWTCDTLGCVTWYNKRWIEYTGLSVEEMKEWGWKLVHHPDHVDRVVQGVLRAQEQGEVWEDTFPIRGRDGRFRWFLSRAVPIRDDAGQIVRWFGTNTDITDRLEHEKQLRTVLAELNHRVKNTLAVVNAIANQTIRRSTDLEVFAESFNQRLRSIAKAHSLLTSTEWTGCGLDEVVHSEIDARVSADSQLVISGPAITLLPKHCLAMHMVFHELATNASKYGALKDANGRIEISWQTVQRGNAHWVQIDWQERCTHGVVPPGESGYGSRLVEQSITYDLHGEIQSRYTPEGFACRISFPASAAITGRGRVESECGEAGTEKQPGRVLVVEDNMLLATALVEELEELGVRVLGPANTLDKAMRLVEFEAPAAAILDVDLDGTKVYPLARRLRDRGVPFVLLTGYEPRDLPADLQKSTVLSKPIAQAQIERLVSGILAG